MTLNLRHTDISSRRTARDHRCHPLGPSDHFKDLLPHSSLDYSVISDTTNCFLHLQSFCFLGSRFLGCPGDLTFSSHYCSLCPASAKAPLQPLPAVLPMLCSKTPESKIYLLIVDRMRFYYESLIIDIISFTAMYSNF